MANGARREVGATVRLGSAGPAVQHRVREAASPKKRSSIDPNSAVRPVEQPRARFTSSVAALRAALASVLARLLGIPPELGAGVGLAAVFAAASNTPLALSIMAMELLGAPVFPHVVIVCVLAYLLAGHRSIYPAQRLLGAKGGARLTQPTALRELAATPTPPPPVPPSPKSPRRLQ